MSLKRLLAIALIAALALRILPIVGPILWPSFRQSAARLRRRADLATAAVMIALAVSMLARGEPLYAALVAVLSIPALIAAGRVLAEREERIARSARCTVEPTERSFRLGERTLTLATRERA